MWNVPGVRISSKAPNGNARTDAKTSYESDIAEGAEECNNVVRQIDGVRAGGKRSGEGGLGGWNGIETKKIIEAIVATHRMGELDIIRKRDGQNQEDCSASVSRVSQL
jgi:hypothetical protein